MSSEFPSPDSSISTAFVRASLWRRFGAFVHELLFLVAYLFIVGLIFASVSGESMSAGKPQILTGPIAVLQQFYLFASVGAYFVFFWTRGRRTLAFKTWQLRLVSNAALASATSSASVTNPANTNAAEKAITKNNAHPLAFAAISTRQAVVRYLATWIGPALAVAIFAIGGKTVGGWWILALFANFFWALVERDRRFLHDRIAGTRVVFSLE
jgi:uncharacterized RDD family membrane protein YckC